MVRQWFAQSERCNIDLDDYKGEKEFSKQTDDGNQRIVVCNPESCFAFQFVSTDGNAVYTNTYIMRTDTEPHIMFVRLERELKEGSANFEKRWSIPKLMRQIFWEEYGGMDNNILTDDKSVILKKNDVPKILDIISGTTRYINPIVYISPYQNTGKYPLDYNSLAAELLGMAHVMVEGSPTVSKIVHDESPERHPFDGKIGIYLPSGEFQTVAADSHRQANRKSLSQHVAQNIRDAISHVVPGDKFSFQRIRMSSLLAECDDKEGIIKLSEDILNEREQELMEALKREHALESELSAARTKIASMEAALRNKNSAKKGLVIATGEHDLYDGEVLDVVLKALQNELKKIDGDVNTQKSRKADVLRSILSANELTKEDEHIRSEMTSIMSKDGNLNEKVAALKRLGFDVNTDGKKHYKVTFAGDDRYCGILSITPSDHREPLNFVSVLANMLFGY